jgi:nucleoporin GLE1
MYNNSNGPHRLLAESHSRDFKELLVPPRLVLSLLLIVCPCSTVMNSETPDEIKMASTLRRSHHSASYAHELQFQTRNSQEKHTEILEAQRLRGEAVREAALQALRSEEIRQAQERLDQLREGALLAEKEAKIEEEQRLEHIRIREAENRRKQLPPVPARLPTPPAPAPPAPVPQAASVNQQSSVQTPATSQQPAPKIAPAAQPIVQQRPPTQQDQSNATTQQSLFKPGALVNLAQPAYKSPPLLHTAARLQKYTEIHQQLKQLRKFVADAGKTNPVFKKLTGDMRREITKFMGQIVPIPAEVPGQPKPATPGPNSVQVSKSFIP